ncbi:MAG: hypothetical protein GY757_13845, partial [bacterium]|nr:hypothetical protein [bacterium]
MKKIIILTLLTLILLSVNLYPAAKDTQFNKGIANLLLEDYLQAGKHLNAYFVQNPNPTIKNGFELLLDDDIFEAARQFNKFLNINRRSTTALVGIALSTANMKVSNTSELLVRAIRLKSSCSAAYICLGYEYLKKKNYPMAEKYYKRALQYSPIPEYKVLTAMFYLQISKPETALKMIKKDADRFPDNFYLNLLTAKAYYQMNQLNEIGQYIQAALDVRPGDNEAKLLMAKYFLSKNNPQKAKSTLKNLKFKDYNEDYYKTYGHALLKLKDKKADDYLYEVLKVNQWDKHVNQHLGLFHLWLSKKNNIQNWIYRILLSGNDIEQVKELFPEKYKFPDYKTVPFFNVKKMLWLSDQIVVVAAVRKSGIKDNIYIIDIEKMKVLKTLSYRGELQEIFASKNRKSIIVTTEAKQNTSTYLYTLLTARNNFKLQLLSGRPFQAPAVDVGFNSTGTLAYITDKRINDMAFDAPFSSVSQLGEKTPVYPDYPFPILKYNSKTRRLSRIKDMSQLNTIPIPSVKKYASVSDAIIEHSQIEELVNQGEKLDITSEENVKIFHSIDYSSFIIYLSDVNNGFKGLVFDKNADKLTPIDAIMFLGKKRYAEIILKEFNPDKKEILLHTKDDKNELILYNYHSHLYTTLSQGTERYH